MNADKDRSQLLGYLMVLRRRWLTVALTILVAAALTTAYVLHTTRVYQATAELELTPQVSSAVLQANNAAANSASALVDVPTAIQVIEGRALRQRVQRQIPNPPSVSATQIGTTNVVSLAVRSPSPRLAQRGADEYARQYINLERANAGAALSDATTVLRTHVAALAKPIRLLQSELAHASGAASSSLTAQLSSLQESQISLQQQLTTYETAAALATGGGDVVSSATLPKTPVKPKPVEYLVLAVVLGLIIGIGLALLRDTLDDKIEEPEDLERVLGGVPVIGSIPAIPAPRRAARQGLVAVRDDPRTLGAEAYRMLRASLRFVQSAHDLRVIQVASARPGDGKTTTIANLGVALAQAGQRVVLVDCDLRRPQLHAYFNVDNSLGVSSVLTRDASVHDVISPAAMDLPNLSVVPSGPVPPLASELLSGSHLDDLLRYLADTFDIVLVDSPPVLAVADASVLATHVDAVILVVGAGVSGRREVAAALAAVARVSAPVRGVVINRLRQTSELYYTYYGGDTQQRSARRESAESSN